MFPARWFLPGAMDSGLRLPRANIRTSSKSWVHKPCGAAAAAPQGFFWVCQSHFCVCCYQRVSARL